MNELKLRFAIRDLYRGDGGPLNDYNQGWNDGTDAAAEILYPLVERAEAALAAIKAAHPDGWQPIETAPKNGKWVLLWWPFVVERPMVGYCLGETWHSAPSTDTWSGDPPTQWMPLPAAPKEAR